MKGQLLFVLFFFSPFFLAAQCCHDVYGNQIDCCNYSCIDSCVQASPYTNCPPQYEPVCGCDGNTYRNKCVAETGYGVCPGGLLTGSCGNFDVDLYPNILSPRPNDFGRLSIYMKNSGSASVLIYSSYGRLMFETTGSQFITIQPGETIEYDLHDPQHYQTGVYLLAVLVNGEQITRRFVVTTY